MMIEIAMIVLISMVVALSGVNLLSRFFKKREVNRFASGLLRRKVKLG